jgi:hypothetical protein
MRGRWDDQVGARFGGWSITTTAPRYFGPARHREPERRSVTERTPHGNRLPAVSLSVCPAAIAVTRRPDERSVLPLLTGDKARSKHV